MLWTPQCTALCFVTNPPLPTIMYAYANWVAGVSCRFLSVSLGLLILAEVFLSVSSGKAQLTGPSPPITMTISSLFKIIYICLRFGRASYLLTFLSVDQFDFLGHLA